MNESKNVYPKGMLFFKKNDKAPSWVIGELIINPTQLFDWIADNADQLVNSEKYGNQLKLTLTEKGLQVNTFQPKKQEGKSDLPF